MSSKRADVEATKRRVSKFVRYKECAEMYCMCQSKFEQLAKEANACYKIDKIVLVNTEILAKYMETFRMIFIHLSQCDEFCRKVNASGTWMGGGKIMPSRLL